ncbi:MAG: AbrB/MazE/SpoVT family DNA-binding domain-containing protein [Proteobacteria bacterium]|nr:AbrB/MazE/SpoVT family DNA-binding domain-containing protein [Pseudomonadota bacterium]MBU1738019.1 AbrB/MazE/SpoVT family DNA-binding domain-containing protein [Pseudomonadota bacterium]
MALATITTKGQITIPQEVRKSLNLHTGDKLEIIATSEGEALIRPVSRKVDDVFCMLQKSGRKAVSVDTMNATIKKRLAEKYK